MFAPLLFCLIDLHIEHLEVIVQFPSTLRIKNVDLLDLWPLILSNKDWPIISSICVNFVLNQLLETFSLVRQLRKVEVLLLVIVEALVL